MNETQRTTLETEANRQKRRRKKETGDDGKIILPSEAQLTRNFNAELDENEGYIPPDKESYKNVESGSLIFDGKVEAASALLMGVLAGLAESQTGLGIGHYIAMQAILFGIFKEVAAHKLVGEYNLAQNVFSQRRNDQEVGYLVEENQEAQRLPRESMLSLAKSIVAPFLAYEAVQNFPEIMTWAGENPLFVLSIVGIVAGVAKREAIANSIINAWNGISTSFKDAAKSTKDYFASFKRQSIVYDVQSPVVFQKPSVEFQNPVKSLKGPVEKLRWFGKFRLPFTRSRENDQENTDNA